MLARGKRFSQAELTQLLQSLLHEACHGSGGDDVFLKCGCHGVDSGIEVIHCILCAINSRVQGFLCRPLRCLMFRARSLQRCLHSFGLGWQSESMNVATVVGRRRHPWGRRFPGASRWGRCIARSTEARKLVGGCRRHGGWCDAGGPVCEGAELVHLAVTHSPKTGLPCLLGDPDSISHSIAVLLERHRKGHNDTRHRTILDRATCRVLCWCCPGPGPRRRDARRARHGISQHTSCQDDSCPQGQPKHEAKRKGQGHLDIYTCITRGRRSKHTVTPLTCALRIALSGAGSGVHCTPGHPAASHTAHGPQCTLSLRSLIPQKLQQTRAIVS